LFRPWIYGDIYLGEVYIFNFGWRVDLFPPSDLRLEKANNYIGNVKRG
jgi:hypothetical protein